MSNFQQIKEACEAASAILKEHDSRPDTHFHYVWFVESEGQKYTRVVRDIVSFDTGERANQPSAVCFIDHDGNVWKPASWKSPTKNKPRGNIEDFKNKEFVIRHKYGF